MDARARQAMIPADFARAHFLIETAQQHGVTFAIENVRLAMQFPLTIEPALWCQLQSAILANKQIIANCIYSRERGLI